MAIDPSFKGAREEKGALPPDQAKLGLLVTEMDNELAALKARFEQYFMGLEKKSPAKDCEDYKKRLLRLKGQFIRNTGLKFRVGSLHQKFMSYERLWLKTLKEMEEGTYRRDLAKLRRKNAQAPGGPPSKPLSKPAADPLAALDDLDVDLDDFNEAPEAAPAPVAPPPAPKPAALKPAASTPPPPPPEAAVRPSAPATPKPSASPAAASAKAPAPSAPAPKPAASLSLSSGAAAKPAPSFSLSSGLGAKPVAPPRPAPPARTVSQPGLPAAGSPKPAAPARPAPPPAGKPAAGGDPLSADRMQALYTAYVTAKKQCKESTAGLTYDAVAQSVQKQVPKLMQQPGVKSVDFKVVIQNGKAVLKAVTKQ